MEAGSPYEKVSQNGVADDCCQPLPTQIRHRALSVVHVRGGTQKLRTYLDGLAKPLKHKCLSISLEPGLPDLFDRLDTRRRWPSLCTGGWTLGA